MTHVQSLIETGWEGGYRLLDRGFGRKLEQVGPYRIIRPEEQAMAAPVLNADVWDGADAVFTGKDDEDQGRWKTLHDRIAEMFPIDLEDVKFYGRFTNFRHLGFFPEQRGHWHWMRDRLQPAPASSKHVLNLFAYSGVASVVAARAGAHVTHLDASKKANGWFRENMILSGLEDSPIRIITEDARAFVAREIRRAKTYDMILVDPPKFGRGTDGEVWNLFTDLPALLRDCATLLAPGGSLILTSYAIRASSVAFRDLCQSLFDGRLSVLESGELILSDTAQRLFVPTSHYVRLSVVS